MTALASLPSDQLGRRYRQAGWLVIPRDRIFASTIAAEAAMASLRDAIRSRPLVDDQPGCERHHLDESAFVDLLAPWLHCGQFQGLCRDVFQDEDVFVKYLRSRNPVHGQGEQELHSDWYQNCPHERMEVFVALDEVTLDNGPLEIQTSAVSEPVAVTCEPGAMVVMDSVIPHRGTTNRRGASRQVVSAHVGIRLRADEQALAFLRRAQAGSPARAMASNAA